MTERDWNSLSLEQRLTAARYDIMKHPEFALLSGVVMMGDTIIDDTWPTAATNGRDCIYGRAFMQKCNRKQTRWVVLHENFHKALRHCVLYEESCKKYPEISNHAMDYVVNAMIEHCDPSHDFTEHPPAPALVLLDIKYYDWSYLRVLQDLLRNGAKEGVSGGGSFDEHLRSPFPPEVQEKIDQQITDALHQGKILSNGLKARSKSGTGGDFNIDSVQDRTTNWREQLRDFVSNILRGNDIARYSRINTRIYAATGGQVILPTLFNEAVGDILIAADTSGSMTYIYPTLFGEVSRVAEDTQPTKLMLLWWDTKVAKKQEFTPESYPQIRSLLKPAGGGGTEPQVVLDYINEHKLAPQCVIVLTDGYIGTEPTGWPMPVLWGVVDNEGFNAKTGKTLHINSF